MPARKWEKPTLEETLELLDELTKRYARDIELLEETRELRGRTWEINVPPELQEMVGGTGFEYRDATIAQDLEQYPTNYTSKLPSLKCEADPSAGEKTVDDLTTRVEDFTTAAMFEECGSRSPGPPTHERLFEGVFSGGAATMMILRRDRWADYDTIATEGYDAEYDGGPKKGQRKYRDADDYGRRSEEAKKKAGVPVDYLYKDIVTLRPRYEGTEVIEMLEVQKRDLITCLRDYQLGMTENGEICPAASAVKDWTKRLTDDTPTVEFIQRWSPKYRYYCVRFNGGYRGAGNTGSTSCSYEIKLPRNGRHNYGFIPYTISLGRTKDYEFARLATAHASETKSDLVRYISFGRTILGYVALQGAMPMLYETIPLDGVGQLEGNTKNPKGPTKYKMGTKEVGQPGATLAPVAFPDIGTKLQVEVQQAEQRLREMGQLQISGPLSGAGEAIATGLERDRARANQFESTICRHLAEDAKKLWKLVASLDEPCYVFGASKKGGRGYIKIDPDDFTVAVRPTFSLHVDSMAADMIQEEYANRRVEHRTLSDDQSIEMQGGNVSEVRVGRWKDRMRESPTYGTAIEQEIQVRWGRKWLKPQGQAEALAAAAGGGPQQGPVAPQGLAVPPGAEGQTSAGAVAVAPGPPPAGFGLSTPNAPSVSPGAATGGASA